MLSFSATHLARYANNPSADAPRPLAPEWFNYYLEAERLAAAFLVSGDVRRLRSELAWLEGAAVESTGKYATRMGDNHVALGRFFAASSELPMGLDCTYLRLPRNPAPLHLGGVAVSVRPLVALQQRKRGGGLEVGALKLHASKRGPLRPSEAEYVTSLLCRWARRHLRGLGRVNPELCMVVDTASGEVHTPPSLARVRSGMVEEVRRVCGALAGQAIRLGNTTATQ